MKTRETDPLVISSNFRLAKTRVAIAAMVERLDKSVEALAKAQRLLAATTPVLPYRDERPRVGRDD